MDLGFGTLRWTTRVFGLLLIAGLCPTARAQFNLNKLKKYTDKVQKVQEATKPMTVDQERELGREVAAKMIAAFHVYRNDALTRYVNEVGATVAAKSERQDIQYHFAVLDSDEINAFSAPGGYVFVTRAALMLCQDESELAGVLAHEVGHISGKHVVHMIEKDKKLSAGVNEASAYTPGSAYLQNITKNVLIKIFTEGLAPADEFDADARGVRYAHDAGYPAGGLERFLAQLDKATQSGAAQTSITKTHPPVQERDQRIQQLIAQQQWQDSGRPELADRYATLTAMLRPKAAL